MISLPPGTGSDGGKIKYSFYKSQASYLALN